MNKFNIGDTVFFIEDKQVVSKKITCIINVNVPFQKKSCDIYYGFLGIDFKFDISRTDLILEKYLFKTKDELLKSL